MCPDAVPRGITQNRLYTLSAFKFTDAHFDYQYSVSASNIQYGA